MTFTPKQKAVFDYIKHYISENGFSPTFEEIAYNFKYKSKGTVYKHIKALKLKGLIRQDWNRVRSIQLTETKTHTSNLLPVKGEWKKNSIMWYESNYEFEEAAGNTVYNNNAFLIKIKTAALEKHNIIREDQIVVQPTVSKHCAGFVIVKNRNSSLTLYKPSWNRSPKRILGQISGVTRNY